LPQSETGVKVFPQFPATFQKTFMAGLLSVRERPYDASVGERFLHILISKNTK
jgi:hypothetical protein